MNLPWNKKRELVICPSKANQSTSELHVCLGYRSKAEAASRGETHFNLNLPIILSLFIYLFISLFIRALSCPTDITTESRGTPPSVPSLRMNTNLPPLFPPFEFIQPQKKSEYDVSQTTLREEMKLSLEWVTAATCIIQTKEKPHKILIRIMSLFRQLIHLILLTWQWLMSLWPLSVHLYHPREWDMTPNLVVHIKTMTIAPWTHHLVCYSLTVDVRENVISCTVYSDVSRTRRGPAALREPQIK